jgi:RNA polymerase sigma factor (sigma-70 family)
VVRSAASGDPGARAEFARTYEPIIRAYLGARWRGSTHRRHIDDAAQDTFLDCFREDGALRRVDPSRPVRFRTYLFGVVRNVALRYEEGRPQGRERAADTVLVAALPAREEALSVVFDRAYAQAIVRRAAERQERAAQEGDAEARERVEVLRLRFGEGLPIRTIAQRWDADPARIHRQYRRARQEFRDALHAEVSLYHQGTPAEVDRECEALLELLG